VAAQLGRSWSCRFVDVRDKRKGDEMCVVLEKRHAVVETLCDVRASLRSVCHCLAAATACL